VCSGLYVCQISDVDKSYIEETFTMAAQAAERGDRPCGSILVVDDVVFGRDTNRVNSDDDISFHPELSLVRQLENQLSGIEQRNSVLYTTIEPCSMCAAAMTYTKLSKVVFSISGAQYWKLVARFHSVPDDYIGITEVFKRLEHDCDVVGSVLESKGLSVVQNCLDQ